MGILNGKQAIMQGWKWSKKERLSQIIEIFQKTEIFSRENGEIILENGMRTIIKKQKKKKKSMFMKALITSDWEMSSERYGS